MTLGELKKMTVSTGELCRLLQITKPTLYTLEREGYFARLGRGTWPLIKCTQGYFRHIEAKQDNPTTASKIQTTEARTRLIEMQISQIEAETIPASEALAGLDFLIETYLESIASMPAKITTDKRERERLETIFSDQQARLKKSFAKIRATLSPTSNQPATS